MYLEVLFVKGYLYLITDKELLKKERELISNYLKKEIYSYLNHIINHTHSVLLKKKKLINFK